MLSWMPVPGGAASAFPTPRRWLPQQGLWPRSQSLTASGVPPASLKAVRGSVASDRTDAV